MRKSRQTGLSSTAGRRIEQLESRTLLSATLTPTAVSNADVRWVRSALANDQLQIQLANLASSRASNQQVLSSATALASSYTASQQALQQDASTLEISPSATLSAADQSKVRRLTNLSGTAFDRAYTAQAIPDENAALSAARRENASTQNALLRNDASKDVATLQSNLVTSRVASNAVRVVVATASTNNGGSTTSTIGGITSTSNQFGTTATFGNGASTLTISPINVGFATGAVAGSGATFGTTAAGTAIGGTSAAGVTTGAANTGFGYTSTLSNGNSSLTISPVDVNSVLNGGRSATTTLQTTAAGTNFNGASATATTTGFGAGAAIGGTNSPTVSGAVGGIGDTAVNGASGGIDSRNFNGITTPTINTFSGATFSDSATSIDGAFSTGTVSGFF